GAAEPRVARQGDRASLEERADRAADAHREVRGHPLADDPADPVRPEEAGHFPSRSPATFAWGGTWTPSPKMLSRTSAPSPIATPAPRIEDAMVALSSTLPPSRNAASEMWARPILQARPKTTFAPTLPSTNDPAVTWTGCIRTAEDTSASGEIFARLAARRRRCAFR